jgi:hypothetical protein
MLRSSRWPAAVILAVLAPLAAASAQSTLAVSPFLGFLPSAGTSPLAGLALTLGGSGGFAVRGSATLALENSYDGVAGGTNGVRPWGADADAMYLFGGRGRSRTFTPYAFVGIGTQTTDDLGFSATTHNWSYGAGAAVPIGSSVDLFGEGRWRESRYVLPTAVNSPATTTELRFGVSFRVGSNQQDQQRRGRGHRISLHVD